MGNSDLGPTSVFVDNPNLSKINSQIWKFQKRKDRKVDNNYPSYHLFIYFKLHLIFMLPSGCGIQNWTNYRLQGFNQAHGEVCMGITHARLAYG